MKSKWIRAFSIVLVAVMLTFTFSACGGSSKTPETNADTNNTPTPEKLEPITFTIYGGGSNPGTFEEDAVHKYIREKLGVDIQSLYTANDTDTQLNLMLAGGDYPDAISQKYGPKVQDFVTGGHILDLTEWYKKYLPRLDAMQQKTPRLFKFDIPDFSEQNWYIPCQVGSSEYPNIDPTMGMRFDIWKMLADDPAKLPKPKDLDEFYDMAKAMVAAQPEYEGKKCYAFSGWLADGWGGQWLVYALTRFGGSYQWVGAANASDDYMRKYCFDSPTWMYAMRFFNRAYRDGIADPEAVTMNQEAYNKKLAQGLIYCTPYSGFWLDGTANTARAAAGHPEQKIVPYTWMSYPASSGVTDKPITGAYDPRGIVKLLITKNCKQAEEIVKRLSWLSTEEGIALQGMGVEGVHWDYDAEGFRKPKDEIIQQYINDPDFIHKTGVDKWNIFSNYFYGCDSKGDAYRIGENKYVQATREDTIDKEYKELLGLNLNLSTEANAAKAGAVNNEVEWSVDLGVTGTPLADIESQLGAFESEYIGKLYLAKTDAEFDKLIAEWRKKCENIKYMDYYNHINPIIQKAYKEYAASH